MNANTELLNFIYQNSQMGVDTVRQLMDITERRFIFRSFSVNIWRIPESPRKGMADAE